ncbi:MAG: tRNA (cytidine(34)-2'-O)-methyltransferase [Alphaproteobacteria bacterium]|nr:tRNA (cytidine(34)-2'-O)-methyltransferase [Alphaproteobacteria bacterium]
MRLALYAPDMPQTLGAAQRLCACLDVPLDVIEPCGFPFDDRRIRRVALDYGPAADLRRHADLERFMTHPDRRAGRLILLTTKASGAYCDFAFGAGDTLLLGRESAGVPDALHARADARLRIPMRAGMRSLNIVSAGAMVLGEALRQIGGFPAPATSEDTSQ